MINNFQVILITIVTTSAITSINGNSIDSVTKYQTDSCSDRASSGFICMTCDILATCIKLNQKWETIPLEVCDADNGLYCNSNEGKCSASTGPCNPIGQTGNFVCTSPGVFPDPFDCQLYHMCYQNGPNLVAVNVQCGRNSAFNPTTGDCSLTTNDYVCKDYQFTCDYVGQSSAWLGNDNIFYICMAQQLNGKRILFPTLYRCSPDEMFLHGECLTKPYLTSKPNKPPPNNFLCPRTGLFAHLQDCKYYHYCSGSPTSTLLKCPEGTYFQRKSAACVRGTC